MLAGQGSRGRFERVQGNRNPGLFSKPRQLFSLYLGDDWIGDEDILNSRLDHYARLTRFGNGDPAGADRHLLAG